jgi:hypothetical protein
MALYTFIMQYLGGTYIKQVTERNELEAMRKWLRELDISKIDGFTELDKQKLIIDDFSDEEPIVISGCRNVWCFGLRTSQELALINFVLTQV